MVDATDAGDLEDLFVQEYNEVLKVTDDGFAYRPHVLTVVWKENNNKLHT